nr:Omp28 family outer membrane lipoprotein [uncultured Prevotella sp.]
MKSFYICLLAAVALLPGCDSVGSDERLIEVPAATVQRNVLIEDFTGQRCIFCPDAAEVIEQQQKLYGADKLIAVAFHAGPLAIKSTAGFVGLRTDVGDAYYKYWAVPNVPKAIINRRGGVLSKDTWAGRIYDEFAQTTTIGIDLKCQYEVATRQVEIETDLKTLAEDVKGKLQLWLVEDSIVAPQMFPNNKVEKEYVHNHVFRAAINGEWGTELTLSTKNVHKEKTTYTLPEGIQPNKAWIVGFFYNDSGVLQAVRQKVSL